MKRLIWVPLIIFVLGVSNDCLAGYVFTDIFIQRDPSMPTIDLAGTGFGTTAQVLTLDEKPQTTVESGCVWWSGTASVGGAMICPSPFDGGDEVGISDADNAKTRARSVSLLGWGDPADIGIVLNPNEPGSALALQLDAMQLFLFNADGTPFLGTAEYPVDLMLAGPLLLPTACGTQGTGTSGCLFTLTPGAQQQLWWSGFFDDPNRYIGLGALISLVSAGTENFVLVNLNRDFVPVPEPSSALLVAVGAGALLVLRRRRAKA